MWMRLLTLSVYGFQRLKPKNCLNFTSSQVTDMPHVMELFGKTRIVVKDGKVVEVGEPIADWCPVFSKVAGVSKLTAQEAKKNM
ncbi:MAG: DUF2099 family protein, partial [Candidatus Methanoperedens sp.]